ncbi:MAG: hypothetical protein AAGB05_11330 [Pseudomonadota bacterium]
MTMPTPRDLALAKRILELPPERQALINMYLFAIEYENQDDADPETVAENYRLCDEELRSAGFSPPPRRSASH